MALEFMLLTLYMKVLVASRVRLFASPWTIAHQDPLSVGFSRQEYSSGLPFPSPKDLPDPGIKTRSPVLQADPLLSEPPGKPSSTLPKATDDLKQKMNNIDYNYDNLQHFSI